MTKCVLLLSVVMLGTIPLVGVRADPSKTPQETAQPHVNSSNRGGPVHQDISYGTAGGHPLLLDVYEPEAHTDLRPAVVLIHGGGWTSFDKSIMRAMATFLAQSGFVAFSVDYRLFHGNENLWPTQLEDVQRAVRWIRANAAKYRVDPDHIGAFGHSAGGQLAALLGMEDTRDNSDRALAKYSSRVQAVVDVSGPSDLTSHRDPDGDVFLTAFFGGDYAQRPEVWQDASPVFHVSKKASPFLIVHGTQDTDVPLARSQELAGKLKQARVPVKLVTVEDVHTFRTPEANKRLALETQAFFFQYLHSGNLR